MEVSKSGAEGNNSTNAQEVVEGWYLQYAKLVKNRRSLVALVGCVVVFIALSYAALICAPTISPFYGPSFLPPQIRTFFGLPHDVDEANPSKEYERRVKEVFERAAMPSKTVIITTLNAAWSKEGTMIDMFLESFWHGNGTRRLLQHLIIVCVDEKAYQRCLVIHPHCVYVTTPGVNFSGEQLLLSEDYIKLMWRRIKFLKTVLQMNYSFVFTDTDVLWFRDPFPRLQSDTQADFQIACDHYNGNPSDMHNSPNAGFTYVRANERTVRFYGYWYEERKRSSNMADQEVLNAIKFDDTFTSIGMKINFLDTQFFGGFCALKSTDMTKAITMHATCCKGLEAKLIDLRMILERWKRWVHAEQYASTPIIVARNGLSHNTSGDEIAPLPSPANVQGVGLSPYFQVPFACPHSWHRH